jgi:uncharacterized protein (DUF305 family)
MDQRSQAKVRKPLFLMISALSGINVKKKSTRTKFAHSVQSFAFLRSPCAFAPNTGRISTLSGDEFDRQYIRAMIDDHKDDLEKFRREADKGGDAAVKQFASKHVPIL